MVYINSRGEVVDDDSRTSRNFFWKLIAFIVLFFKSLVGIDERPDKKNDGRAGSSGPVSGGFGGGGGSGGGGGGGSNSNSRGPRGFGPRGFKSITDFPPPPPTCSGGACG